MTKIRTIITATLLLTGIVTSSAQEKMTYSVSKAGTLITQLTRQGADSIVSLKITGKINAIDFRHLRDEFKHLEVLDLSGADIKVYIGKEGTDEGNISIYKPGVIPKNAFSNKKTLQRIILPYSVSAIDKEAFLGCTNLSVMQLNSTAVPRLGVDAVSDTITTLFVPASISDNYRRNEQWANFSIIEGEPVVLKVQVGKLSSLQNEIQKANMQPNNINFLNIEGKLDDDDFMLIRNYMPNLVRLDITNTTAETIPEFTFSQKKRLVHIDLPRGLKKIGQRAFSGCSKLGGTIYLPATMKAIEYGAFIDCDHVTRVRALGNQITAVGDNLFGTDKNKLVFK
jgi:hypothetical protein